MDPGTLLILALLLACPLMMVFMHRGGHADHGSHGAGHTHGPDEPPGSLNELRQRRDELDAQIAELETTETETETGPRTPAAA